MSESDATPGNTDVIEFGPDVSIDQLWFRRVGSGLEVSIIGSDDRILINNWYSGSRYQVEVFEAGDGRALASTQVNNLVQAMASFAPPTAGQTTLPAAYASALAPVLAANWH